MLYSIWCISRNNILPLKGRKDMAGYAGYEMDLSHSEDSYFTCTVAPRSLDLLEFCKFTHCCPSILARLYSSDPRWFSGLYNPTLAGSKVFVGESG